MESSNAIKVVNASIALEHSQDRVFDVFVEANQFGSDYGECKMKFIAEIEPASILATVHWDGTHYNTFHTLHYAGSKEPSVAITGVFSPEEIGLADLGEVAAAVAVRCALDFTASDPEDNHSDFCFPYIIELCQLRYWNRYELPDIRLSVAYESDEEPTKYEGAIRLTSPEDFSQVRLNFTVLSANDSIVTVKSFLQLDEGKVFSHHYYETEVESGERTMEQCRTKVAKLLANETVHYYDESEE